MAAVTAELDLEISRLRQKLGQANSRLDKFAADARKKGSAFASNFHAGVGNLLKKGLVGLTVGAGIAGLLAGKTFSDSVKAAMDDEQFGVSVEVLVGDAGKAKSLIGQLRKDAASTPMTFADMGGAAKKLLAFGEAAESVPSTLRRIGDVSSAIQAPIGEIAEIYGKARVQGTLFAEDINQLTGRGIPVIQQFAKQLGVAEGEVKKMGSEGKITFDMLSKAFVDLTSEGGLFYGMMARQSKTLGGLWSTFLDGIQELRLAFGRPIAESLKGVLEDGIGLLETMKTKAGEWGEAIASGIDFARAAFQELSGGELLDLAGDGLKLAFMEAVNVLVRGIQAAFSVASESDLVSGLEQKLVSAAETFKRVMLEGVEQIFLALKDTPFAGFEAKKVANNLRQMREQDGSRGAVGARAGSRVGAGERVEKTFAEKFAEEFAAAGGIFDVEAGRARLRKDAAKANARAERNKAEREASKEGGSTTAPQGSGSGSSGPVSYAGGAVQNAVNSLFGRPMEAEAKRQTGLLASIDRRLQNIEGQKPPAPRPPVPGTAGAVGVFGAA